MVRSITPSKRSVHADQKIAKNQTPAITAPPQVNE
jgi:hypothetical protein